MTEQSTTHVAPGATVYVQPAVIQPGNGLATASLVLGIIALTLVWIPLLGMVAWVLAPLGLIFGIIALRKPNGRGFAIAGTVCSALGLLACIGWLLLFGAAAAVGSEVDEQLQDDLAAAAASIGEADKQAQEDLTAAAAAIDSAEAQDPALAPER